MRIEITEAALLDLETLYLDGAAKFGASNAEAYQDALTDSFQKLADFPAAHPERPEIAPGLRSVRFRAHLILCRFNDRVIQILRIRHGRDDWMSG